MRAQRRRVGTLLLVLPWAALAQDKPPTPGNDGTRVLVQDSRLQAGVAGFPDLPLAQVPIQVQVTDAQAMKDLGIRRLSDIRNVDPSVGGSYNTQGYWDFLSVRGYLLDNRFNYQRDGLPINAETSIPLDNKAGIEVLKGIAGMQAGIGSPGGLVNLVVKRPTAEVRRELFVGWRQDASVLASADFSDRFGTAGAVGLRLNAAYEHIDPQVRVASGYRYLLALAGDWRVGEHTLLEAEVENSRRSQPTVPGFSVLGTRVPAPGDPDINLNNQPWSRSAVYGATTGSLRWTQQLDADWRWVAHAAAQRLDNDETSAQPLTCRAELRFDRFCSNGTYDMYDQRNPDQRRGTDALDLGLIGLLHTGTLRHRLSTGVRFTRATATFGPQAFNYAGTGNVQGTLMVPPAPAMNIEGTHRDGRAGELYLRDAIEFDEHTTLWAGLRHTQQRVRSALSDGSRPVDFSQSYNSPWLALSHSLGTGTLLYASWGQSYEYDFAPNLPNYINRGQPLPAEPSRQIEIGAKGSLDAGRWSVAAFDIDRPVSADVGNCFLPDSCLRVRDGSARHRGLEAGLDAQFGAWTLAGGAMLLQARREGSADPKLDGLRPTNVPEVSVKLQLGYRVQSVPGLQILANGLYEGARFVLPDNSLSIPSVSTLDLALRYAQVLSGRALVWRLGIDNLLDQRQWRESPFVYGHSWLFPQAARTLSLSLQSSL